MALYRAGEWDEAEKALHKSMELRQGGGAFDWLFLAMTLWRKGHKEAARKEYDRAVTWMENNKSALEKNQHQAEAAKRFRAEAAALLGVTEPPGTKEQKETPPKN